ncbi:HIT family protein [Candidatus Hodarchaeum mangrovi]
MVDCIFCDIIHGREPAIRIYEDDKTIAFLDIAPLNHGHTLVIPRNHVAEIYHISEEDIAAVAKTVQKVAASLKKILKCDGMNIFNTNEKAAWQEVDHLHFHVIPRWFKDDIKLQVIRKTLDIEEEVLTELKQSLENH